VHDYNSERPHQSIGRVAPIERFSVRDEPTPAFPADTRGIAEDRSGEDWISRNVMVSTW
jgi:hypothetical protein